MDAKAKVLEVMKAHGGPMHERDIASAVGISVSDVRKYLMQLRPLVAAADNRDCYYAK